ncbi:MAG TPA: hypothetical protein VES67_00055 [Vicinamibacterales bacterium]|nr:hypothetical protein [Vicinamibacterales bacterium]
MSESTPAGTQPVSGAIVELFRGERPPSETAPIALRETITDAAGRYLLCFPQPAGGSGLTEPDEEAWEVRARKDGYQVVSKSFRFGYSVWDYGGLRVSLELVREK